MRLAILVRPAAALLLAVGLIAACDDPAPDEPGPVADDRPVALSAWGLLGPGGAPLEGVVAYRVRTSLFSDHAVKERFVRVPPGTRIGYRAEGPLEFPVGTVLVKTFGYHPGRPIETRLLVRRPEGWIGLPYVWSADARDATLRRAGAEVAVRFDDPDGVAHDLDYLVPDAHQCGACHRATGSIGPLGPTARNLGPEGVEAWRAAGILEGAPDPADVPRLAAAADPASGTVAERARAWLEVNCAHCHNRRGPAASSGLFLESTSTDRHALGIGKRPVAAGRGSGGRSVSIAPGDPDASILVHRIESTEPGVRMPELGRQLVDEAGVALIREWIRSLE